MARSDMEHLKLSSWLIHILELSREPCSLKENPFLPKFRRKAGAAEQAVPGLVLLLHLHPLHLQAGVHGKKEGFVFILFLRPMPHNILR